MRIDRLLSAKFVVTCIISSLAGETVGTRPNFGDNGGTNATVACITIAMLRKTSLQEPRRIFLLLNAGRLSTSRSREPFSQRFASKRLPLQSRLWFTNSALANVWRLTLFAIVL